MMTVFDYFSIISYSLTGCGYLMTNIFLLRIFILTASLMDAAIYLFIRPGNPLWVQVSMNLLFVVINIVALIRLIRDRFPPQLYGSIGEIYTAFFSQLTPSEFKALLAIGEWRTVPLNTVLIHPGETGINPMVVVHGSVLIEQNGVKLTSISKGALVGEINFLTNIPPKNSVITAEETELFILPRAKLNQLIAKNSAIKSVIYGSFGCSVANKLKLMNEELSLNH